jgi:hypothetical protein
VAAKGAYHDFAVSGEVGGPAEIVGAVAFCGGLAALGVGLVLRRFYPRRIAAAFCLVIAVFLPMELHPFSAMDQANHPAVHEVLKWMGPAISGLLFLAWLIDPHGKQPNTSLERTRER